MATLAANVAHGWTHGPVGAAVAAWPAASLVGSYELLLWLIRTAGADREPAAGPESTRNLAMESRRLDRPDSSGTCRPVNSPAGISGPVQAADPDRTGMLAVSRLDQDIEPGGPGLVRTENMDQSAATRTAAEAAAPGDEPCERDVEIAATAAYLASMRQGMPLSERRLAAMFGKTSRRWSRKRMAEARQTASPSSATSLSHV